MEQEAVKLIVALLVANGLGVGGIWLSLGGLKEAVRSLRARVERLESWQDAHARGPAE